MRKLCSFFSLLLWGNMVWAQVQEQPEAHQSSTIYLIIGAILLIVVILILFNKQKRKFNH